MFALLLCVSRLVDSTESPCERSVMLMSAAMLLACIETLATSGGDVRTRKLREVTSGATAAHAN